ncbi:hypothetical protein D3C84_407620 [compost metagenome]
MPGFLPQAAVNDLRRFDLQVAVVTLNLAHVLLEHLVQGPAIGVPEHHARRFFLGMEQVQALADLAVIALLGLFDTLDIGRQLLLVGPGGAIDPLQLLVLGIAAPIGTGQLGQLEGLEKARVRHVRTTAHVDVFFVIVQTHGLLARHVFDQTQLVVLATGGEHIDHLGPRGHLLDHVVVFFDQLLHALLDRRHVIQGKRTLAGNVVVETFFNDRTDHHLGARKQLLDRMTDQMRTGVANDLQPLLVFRRNDLQGRVAVDQIAGIDQLTVDLAGHRRLGQAGANGLGHLEHGYRMIERTLTAVGKSNDGHGASSPSGDLYQRPHGLG